MNIPAPNNCAINEVTGDGKHVGRCWFHLENNICPRHGDVTEVQEHFRETGELTSELQHNTSPRLDPEVSQERHDSAFQRFKAFLDLGHPL